MGGSVMLDFKAISLSFSDPYVNILLTTALLALCRVQSVNMEDSHLPCVHNCDIYSAAMSDQLVHHGQVRQLLISTY